MSCPCPQPGIKTETLGAQAGGAVWDRPVPPEPQPHLQGWGWGGERHGFRPTGVTALFMLLPGRGVRAGPVCTLGGFSVGHGGAAACLRVLDVEEPLLGRRCSAVPRAGAVIPLDAGEELGLVPVDALLCDPVHPQALVQGGGVAGGRGAARDLGRGAQSGAQGD